MRRYIFNKTLEVGKPLKIEGELFKHIFTVCRRSVGDRFELLSKDGRAYLVQVEKRERNSASLLVKESREIPKIKKPYIHLVLANPRPTVFESVIEKSVELGVKSIYPVTTENSFFKNIQKLKKKKERLEKITKQALQQTGRVEELTLMPANDLGSFLEMFSKEEKAKGYLFYEAPIEQEIPQVLNEDEPENIFILVGGEGGFLHEEALSAVSAGFEAFLLGEQILRVETACVAGISILKSKLGVW